MYEFILRGACAASHFTRLVYTKGTSTKAHFGLLGGDRRNFRACVPRLSIVSGHAIASFGANTLVNCGGSYWTKRLEPSRSTGVKRSDLRSGEMAIPPPHAGRFWRLVDGTCSASGEIQVFDRRFLALAPAHVIEGLSRRGPSCSSRAERFQGGRVQAQLGERPCAARFARADECRRQLHRDHRRWNRARLPVARGRRRTRPWW